MPARRTHGVSKPSLFDSVFRGFRYEGSLFGLVAKQVSFALIVDSLNGLFLHCGTFVHYADDAKTDVSFLLAACLVGVGCSLGRSAGLTDRRCICGCGRRLRFRGLVASALNDQRYQQPYGEIDSFNFFSPFKFF